MKVIIASAVASVVLGIGAALVLNQGVQQPAYEAYSTSGTRVGDPGENLVGQNWSGNPNERAPQAAR